MLGYIAVTEPKERSPEVCPMLPVHPVYVLCFGRWHLAINCTVYITYPLPVYTYVYVCRCNREVVRSVCLFMSDFCPISFLLIKFNVKYVPACHGNRITVTCAVKVWADVRIFFSANYNVFHVERKLVYLIATPCVQFSAVFLCFIFLYFYLDFCLFPLTLPSLPYCFGVNFVF